MKTKHFAVGVLMGVVLGGMISCATVREEVLPSNQAQYVIGPEDVLDIYVWKESAISRQVTVRIDGKISLPLINEVQAAGLTPLQLKEELTQRFRDYVDMPNVSVMVIGANSSKVFVSGQVNQVVLLRSPMSMLYFMVMVGGPHAREILVIRNESGKEKRYTMNYQKILKGTEPDFILKSGDSVIVLTTRTATTPSGTTPPWITSPMTSPSMIYPSITPPSVAPPSGATE
jgi:polysaccharide biosynthesis/export protein